MKNSEHKPFWDIGYGQLDISCMGGPSVEVFEVAQVLKPNSKILEIGCGEGRNALFLAQLSHDVYATDISQKAVAKLNHLANEFNVSIQASQEDLAEMVIPNDIDMMIAQSVFHFLERPQWQQKLSEAKENTAPGGIHCFTTVLEDENYPIPDEIIACGHKRSFDLGDLKEFYSDWDIIRFDHYVKWDSHPGIDMHSHTIEKFVARKPGGDLIQFNKTVLLDGQSPEKLTDAEFDQIKLNISREQVLSEAGQPIRSNKTTVPVRSLNGNNQSVSINEYAVEDLHYGKYGLQLVNDLLTGKYLYFSSPIKITVDKDNI